MSKKIPLLSSREFVKLLAKGNARFVRQRSTSHAIFEREKDGKVYRAPVVNGQRGALFQIHETRAATIGIHR